jgi:phosphoenolpyruvate carboxylase
VAPLASASTAQRGGQCDLLADNPNLAVSLDHRKAYLDPLNYIQVVVLRKLRADQREDSPWLEPLLRSINAIAAGMRNTR